MAEHKVSVVKQFIRFLLLIIGVITLGASVCLLDGYLKCKSSGADGKRTFTSRASFVNNVTIWGFVEDCVDIGSLLRIQAIIMPIFFWSLFYSLAAKKSTQNVTQATIEVLAHDDINTVSRNEAK